MQLPTLMKDLNEGMKLIGWPDAAQKEFFGKLLPSHAESLKATPMTELEHNLLAKQLEGIFQAGIPGAHEFSQAEPVTLESQEIEQRFTPDEAQQVGLVEESAVDWSGEVDIDLSAEAPDRPRAGTTPGDADTLPSTWASTSTSTSSAPTRRRAFARPAADGPHPARLRLPDALKDQWQKVRLSYVSPGRNFFVFTRGAQAPGDHLAHLAHAARACARATACARSSMPT